MLKHTQNILYRHKLARQFSFLGLYRRALSFPGAEYRDHCRSPIITINTMSDSQDLKSRLRPETNYVCQNIREFNEKLGSEVLVLKAAAKERRRLKKQTEQRSQHEA